LVNGDALSRFGGDKDFVGSLGLLALPGKLSHCAKKEASAYGWDDLGKLLWDFTIEGKALELGKAQVAKSVVSMHEFSLIIGRHELDAFSFFYWRQGVKGKRPSSNTSEGSSS
jgi:hypothetical protein